MNAEAYPKTYPKEYPEAYPEAEKNRLLAKLFPFLVKSGLENVSIREVCRGTGIAQGTLYYWFNDKTTIVVEAAKWGLRKTTDEIFDYVFANINDLRSFFDNCLDEFVKYKAKLCFIYQMAASPVYGEKIKSAGNDFDFMYDKYTKELSRRLGCDEETLKPLEYLFISAVLNYVLWDKEENVQMQLNFIYDIALEVIKIK